MQTTLIYNPQAGIGPHPGPEDILDALRQVGFDAVYFPTSTESDLDQALSEAKDLVVVAGGDGSIRAVATRLLGKDIRITPLPLGTANNIARTLALNGNPLEIVAGLSEPQERDLDVGRLDTSEGSAYFLEAMGIGVFADVLKRYEPKIGKSVPRSIRSTMETLSDYQPKFLHINLDGEDISGSYLLFEVMNTPTLGLRFMLTPNAKPDDGFFDLFLIHASQRENYLKFVAGVLTGNLESLPTVNIQRGQQLDIAWRGFPIHLDGEVFEGLAWEMEDETLQTDPSYPLDVAGPYIHVGLIKGAIHFLVPKDKRELGDGDPA